MNKTVLIIENDPDTLDVLQEIVSHLGLNPVTKTDKITLRELQKIKPCLILLDHWLPTGFGADYCLTLKTNDKTKHIPVIMVSFIATVKEVAEKAGADDYIGKPFDLLPLEELIRSYTFLKD